MIANLHLKYATVGQVAPQLIPTRIKTANPTPLCVRLRFAFTSIATERLDLSYPLGSSFLSTSPPLGDNTKELPRQNGHEE